MRLEIRAVDYALQKWGYYEDQEISGYAKINPLFRFMTEGAPGKPVFTSTVLHNGTPLPILKLKEGIQHLPPTQQHVVYAKYVVHFNVDGTYLTDQQKAEILGINQNVFRTSLNRARNALLHWL